MILQKEIIIKDNKKYLEFGEKFKTEFLKETNRKILNIALYVELQNIKIDLQKLENDINLELK